MVELQKILFSMLCELDDICRKHGIVYYLSGGTNLGALRHAGFIPWDDDADIRMPRKEFEKLEAVIDSELRDDRELVSVKRYSEYVSPIPRYVNLRSTLLSKGRMADGTPHGIFVDIIILDPIPRAEPELSKWKKLHYVYCELLEHSAMIAGRKSDWDVIDIDLYKKYYERSKREGRQAILRSLEDQLFSIDEKDADNYCMRFGTTWLGITPIEWYGKPRELPYEGRDFYVADKAELCANANYGPEWKYIPDVANRTTHSLFRILELDSGNCEREYLQLVKSEDVISTLIEFKEHRINYFPLKFDAFMIQHGPLIDYINRKIEIDIEKYGKEAIREESTLGLQVFREYIKLQLDTALRQNSLYVPLSDENADLMTHVLYSTNRLFKLQRILHIRETATGLSEYQQEIKSVIDDIIEMMKLLDCREYDAAKCISDKYIGLKPFQISLIRGRIVTDIEAANTQDEYRQIESYIEEMLEVFPNDGDLLKYSGDIAALMGDFDKARKIYENAIEYIDNGIMLLELSKLGINKAVKKISKLSDDEADEDEEIDTDS